ncbi:MAG: prepilin-type N-terminal cleavage/methylation domain-containing protein [Sulfurisoma sp.]|nr:prepilin-type N-terminal cleavage/methylation domain-containing protein [Sulfurisoma sp.]
MSARRINRGSSGFTLIEMIIAIVIIGVGLAGVLTAFNTTVKSSADPLIHKQMLAVAEEMMEEILLKPYEPPAGGFTQTNTTWPVACAPATAARRADFDDVSDYSNYETTGICDIDGTAVSGLGGYGVKGAIDPTASLGGLASDVKKVTVMVTYGTETLSLVGWRTNYAAP